MTKKLVKNQNSNNEIPYWQTPEFKALDAKWKAKLEKSGFNEIETGEEPNAYLKRWDATWFTNRRHGWQGTVEQQTYFQECTRFLHEHQFSSKKEQTIWLFHSEGCTVSEIVEKMLSKRFKVNSNNVRLTVNRLKELLLAELKRSPEHRN